MMNHARAGAAEIARPLAALEAYARTLATRFDQQFDLLYDATLANPDVDAFLRTQNPDAHADMTARFQQAQQAGLWHPKRNQLAAAAE
jgi:cobaltochelatase CobN